MCKRALESLRTLLASVTFLAFAGFAYPASAQTQTVVEYYHAGWGHYFVTSFQDEMLARV